MKRKHGQVSLAQDRVQHFQNAVGCCHICGDWAFHIVSGFTPKGTKGKGKQYLCTKHFAMLYHLPPNRHPKKVKEPKTADPGLYPGYHYWSLRRHMDLPLRFGGERIVSHNAKIGAWEWFWSLYWIDVQDLAEPDYALSVTRAVDKKHAVHMVQLMDGRADLIEQVKFMFHAHGTIAPVSDAELLALTMEATRFIEKSEVGQLLDPYRADKEKMKEVWREQRDAVAAEMAAVDIGG